MVVDNNGKNLQSRQHTLTPNVKVRKRWQWTFTAVLIPESPELIPGFQQMFISVVFYVLSVGLVTVVARNAS